MLATLGLGMGMQTCPRWASEESQLRLTREAPACVCAGGGYRPCRGLTTSRAAAAVDSATEPPFLASAVRHELLPDGLRPPAAG